MQGRSFGKRVAQGLSVRAFEAGVAGGGMRVAVFGASGFIGSAVVGDLLSHGFDVRSFCRQPLTMQRRFPRVQARKVQLTQGADDLARELRDCDALVNCIGVLRAADGVSETDVHIRGMELLTEAARRAEVRRIVHLSAVGIETAQTAYAASKRAGDQVLEAFARGNGAEAIILHPSFVYGRGSYGGSSALRGLAGLPVMPLPSGGGQKFQPVCLPDLTAVVRAALIAPLHDSFARHDVCGPDTLTLREIAQKLRAWLGFSPARSIGVPDRMTRLLARIGDVFPLVGGLCTAIYEQLATDYVSGAPDRGQVLGVRLRSMDAFLQENPASVQDRWHARLLALRPLAASTIVALWVGSGLAGLRAGAASEAALQPLGISPRVARGAGYALSLVDLWLAWRTARGKPVWRGQMALVFFYTVGLTGIRRRLWGDPYGALLKNIPILGLMILMSQTQDDR